MSAGPLREFVYLDEVSVYSLLASQEGPLAVEFTENASTETKASVSGKVSASAILAAEMSSSLDTSRSFASQILRKSNVQDAFKRLRDLPHATRELRAAPGSSDVAEEVDLRGDFPTLIQAGRIIDPAALSRGSLIEMTVELEAEDTFRVANVVSTFLDMFNDIPILGQMTGVENIEQAMAMTRLLEKFLAGLVPLRGRAVDYDVFVHGGREYLIDRSLVTAAAQRYEWTTYPLYVVGVAEEAHFWKDLRRVLFSRSRYDVMCRIGRSGVQSDWTPVKVGDVVSDVLPEVGRDIGSMGRTLLQAFVAGASATPEGELSVTSRDLVILFARSVAELAGVEFDEDALQRAGLLNISNEVPSDVEGFRTLFRPTESFFADRSAEPLDRVKISELRADVQRLSTVASSPVVPDAAVTSGIERYLDCEFVAIYW